MTNTSSLGKRILKIFLWIVGIVVVLIAILVSYVLARWDSVTNRPAPALTAPRDSASISHGEYIFKYQAQCWSCHAPGASGPNSPPSGGMEFDLREVGPGFGLWYSANLTPDVETGIGGWTDGEIVQAMREGLRKDRTVMFPLMPIDWYHGISDDDALSIIAYLRSLPAVRNNVPPHKPSFFAKALFTFGVLKPKEAVTAPIIAPKAGATVEYGKYLANTVAGCLDCHTPRNLQNGAVFFDSLGAGSTFRYGADENAPIQTFARNLTPDKETGIGNWTEAQFISASTGGMRPDGTVLAPHMPYSYFKFCTEDDMKAIFLYLQSLPPIKRSIPSPVYSSAMSGAHGTDRGNLLFRARCKACHGKDGNGAQPTKVVLSEVAPSINDADLKEFINAGDPDLKMPGFAKTLREEEMNDLIAFMRSWEKK